MSIGPIRNSQRQFLLPLTVSILLPALPPAALAAKSANTISTTSRDCTAAEAQILAPGGMTVSPIPNLNPGLGLVPTGALYIPAANGFPGACQVTGIVVTNSSTGKTANFALVLPDNWNGKFLFWGCGGLCGVVFLGFPADALVKGYAIAATDLGHIATPPGNIGDGSWAITGPGQPNRDAVVDFFYRSVHAVVTAAKQLIENWYANALQRSYFNGCSSGGREALMEAIRYPADFDGIIAGAPVLSFRGPTVEFYKGLKGLLKSNSAYIPSDLLAVVDQKVQEECDTRDGVKDGLIQNPARCAFRPQSLLCKDGNTTNCLSADQIGALESYFKPAIDHRGFVAGFGSTVSDLVNASGLNYFNDFEGAGPPTDPNAAEPWGNSPPNAWVPMDNMLRYLVYRDSEFNVNADFPLNFSNAVSDSAVRLIDQRTEAGDTDEPEGLSKFIHEKRKLILDHGFSDGVLTPFRTIRYYEDLGKLNGGFHHLQENARLFMVPGLYHCTSGGAGPNRFDMLSALENWVEGSVPPEGITATKFVNDDPALGIARTMPLCKFPEMARYKGTGDVNDQSNWTCPSDDQSLLHIGLDGVLSGLNGFEIHEGIRDVNDEDKEY